MRLLCLRLFNVLLVEIGKDLEENHSDDDVKPRIHDGHSIPQIENRQVDASD